MSTSSRKAKPAKSAKSIDVGKAGKAGKAETVGKGTGGMSVAGAAERPGSAVAPGPEEPTERSGLGGVDDLAGLAGGSLVLTPAEGRIAELRMAASDYVQRAIGCELDDSEESLAFVDHYISQVRSGGELRDEVLRLVAIALGVYLGEVTRTRLGGRWVALPPEPGALAPAPAREAGPHPDPLGETPILDSMDDPIGWRLQVAAVPLLVDPIGMALRALQPPGSRDPSEAGPASAATAPSGAAPGAGSQSAGQSSNDTEGTGGTGGTEGTAGPDGSEDPVGFATTPELTAPLRLALSRLPPVTFDYYYSLTGRFETLTYAAELLAELQQKAAASAGAAGPAVEAAPADADADADSDTDPDAASDSA